MKKKLDRLFIAAHILTAIYIYFLGWWSLLFIPFVFLVFHMGHGAFAHRIFTHQTESVSDNAHLVGHFLFNMCGWGSALVFGSIHNMHHRYNGTENDPHEPKYVGKWNIFWGRYNLCTDKKFFRRMYKSPYAAWFHKNYFTVAWIFLPIFAPVTAAGFWFRYLLLAVVHSEDEEKDTSADKYWLWPVLLGDEMHNLHHRNARTPKHHNLDFVYLCGQILKRIP